MAVVLEANEYIIESGHGSSWIRPQKAVSFEGIPIRSVLSNKYLILYPFLDLLYTECLSVSCNSRVSSEISWIQHVPPKSPALYSRRRHMLHVSLYPTQSHLLWLSEFRGFRGIRDGGSMVETCRKCRDIAASHARPAASVLVALRGIPIWSSLLLPWIPGRVCGKFLVLRFLP